MTRSDPPIQNPLRELYRRRHLTLPAFTTVAAAAMPDLYRRLLAHTHDMTPTLEAHYGCRLRLRLLERHATDHTLSRMVVLESTQAPHQPVEFGAIRIHLPRFGRAAQGQILACQIPLGTLLSTYHVTHTCRPAAYFVTVADGLIGQALGLTGAPALYGRFNTLYDPSDAPLAEVVEILAPCPREENQ